MMMCRTHMHHAYVSSLVDVLVCMRQFITICLVELRRHVVLPDSTRGYPLLAISIQFLFLLPHIVCVLMLLLTHTTTLL